MKRSMHVFITLLLMLFLSAGILPAQVLAEEAEEPGKGNDSGIIVLSTNDVHCAIDGYSTKEGKFGGYATLAGYRQQLIDEGYSVVTIDAGDAIQGDVIGVMTKGEAIVNLMNEAGYDLAIPGNHEFDFEVPRFLELVGMAKYQYICSNFMDLSNNKSYFDSYKIFELDDHKIGFVGIATPETYTKSTPTYFQDEEGKFIYSFGEDDYYNIIQGAIDACKADGAEVVIAIGHTGLDGTTEAWSTRAIIANTNGIDAYVDGHSHEVIPGPDYKGETFLNKDGKPVAESMTGTKFANIGKMAIDFDENGAKITTSLVDTKDAKEAIQTDAAFAAYGRVHALIDKYNKKVEEYYGVEIGTAETSLYVNDPESGDRIVRNSETNLGDFVADAYRTVLGTDISLVNGGGIRANLNKGAIQRKDLVSIHPYGNAMCVIEASGQTILDALEHAARMYPQELGGFFQVSGVEYTINDFIESPVVLDEQGLFDHVDDSKPRRVSNVKINGQPIDKEKIYTIGGSKYILQQAGDGMSMFKDCKCVLTLAEVDSDILMEYVEKYLDGKIPAESYSEVHGQGRITINQQGSGIVVLSTNDVHCGIDGYATLAGYRQELIDEGYSVVTVDAGDAIQGEVIGLMTKGEAIVNLMNEVGYDLAVPGNHEYDYEVPRFLELVDKAKYQYICSNFMDLVNNKSYFDSYKIIELDGHKIGFVGIATPETYTKSTPTYFMNENKEFIYSFGEDDYYNIIQKAVDACRADGAQVVIAIGHTGLDGTTEAWSTRAIIANTNGIDAYIDGHSHEVIPGPDYKGETFLNKDGKPVAESMTGTKLANIGKMSIDFDENGAQITTGLVAIDDANIATANAKAAYDKVQALIDQYHAEVDKYYAVEIGTAETMLYDKDPETGKRLVRNSETNLGDFVADAYKTVLGADIGLSNGGGLRAAIKPGVFTRKDLVNVNPFGNAMCVIEADGQTILDALEHSSRLYPQELGGFFHVSGLEYTINAYNESPVVLDDRGSFDHVDDSKPRRVANVKINGEPIDPDKIYTVAGTKYILQQAGDGMTMFSDCKCILTPALVDSDTLVKYVEDYLDGKIPAEGYSEIHGQGRIKIYEEPQFTGFVKNEKQLYWYEDGIKQGIYGDPKNVKDALFGEIERGREIYDPESDAWYWLDAIYEGAVAKDKEVWMPYIFQEDMKTGANPAGKWVRYDKHGEMIKGWYANDNGFYYYDKLTGKMFYGEHVINGKTYSFDEITGIMKMN